MTYLRLSKEKNLLWPCFFHRC
uniref:Uncharacterized protein n=1 Tax=Anguilla anguilla TaxID=7936 RepID=A0A0E9S7Q2_ANGAN